MFQALPGPDPLRTLAVRSLASVEAPKPTQAGLKKFRTAVLTVLAAADIDTSGILVQPKVAFADAKHHALVVWYDIAASTLRLFAVPLELIDEISLDGLALLNGSLVMDLGRIPIEDVDATARIMSLLGVGGEDAADVHARFVGPQIHRYAEDFPPPLVSDFEELWGKIFKTYVGGNTHPPNPGSLDVWFDRVYAFGVGWFPPVEKKKPAKKKAAAKKKPVAKKQPAKRR